MFGGKRYFGLKGTRLNIAIGVIAGMDFLFVAPTLHSDGRLYTDADRAGSSVMTRV